MNVYKETIHQSYSVDNVRKALEKQILMHPTSKLRKSRLLASSLLFVVTSTVLRLNELQSSLKF
jgi:hypothetical protein